MKQKSTSRSFPKSVVVSKKPPPAKTEQLRKRLGMLSKEQIMAWRLMLPAERLAIAFQAYQFALDAVRLTERQRHPDLSPQQFNWRVVRRMQGNQKLGRDVCP